MLTKAKKNSVLKIGKYNLKVAILENGTYVFSERDVALFIGGRGGNNFKSLSAKNLQQYISPELKLKLKDRIEYCNPNSRTKIYGYDASTVIEICKIKIKTCSSPSSYRAKIFYDSLSLIGLTALVNEVVNNPKSIVTKNNTIIKSTPKILTKSEILYRVREIISGTQIPTHATSNVQNNFLQV